MHRHGFRLAHLLSLAAILIGTSLASVRTKSFDGLWKSRGYGFVFVIEGPVLSAFEVTSTTCVKGAEAQRQAAVPDQWDARFKSKEEGSLFIRGAEGEREAILHLEDSVPDIRLDQIDKLPGVCSQPAANTPMGNFEVFARTWAEHYISFERRHVDWDAIVAESRLKVRPGTSPAQLFEVFESMIKPLGDLHTYVSAPPLKRSTPTFWRSGTSSFVGGKPGEFADRESWTLFEMINRAALVGAPKMFCNRGLQYGHLDESIGYLRVRSLGGYSRRGDLRALETALDTILSDDKLKALVIDMRLSFGGSDELGLAIASRLTSEAYLAYTVQARSDPGQYEQWTQSEPIMVRPAERVRFRGPVVELTSSITMSAAETFSEALLGRLPRVTRIGESTQGVFCDILDRHLPNRWTFGLPNAVYRAANGTAFDVTGIPPDIDVPLFTENELATGKDAAVAKAVEILRAALLQNRSL